MITNHPMRRYFIEYMNLDLITFSEYVTVRKTMSNILKSFSYLVW